MKDLFNIELKEDKCHKIALMKKNEGFELLSLLYKEIEKWELKWPEKTAQSKVPLFAQTTSCFLAKNKFLHSKKNIQQR